MTFPSGPNAIPPRLKNRTNVRSIIAIRLTRTLIRAGFAVAPAWAAEHTARLFLRPQRRPSSRRSRSVSRETPLAIDGPAGPMAAFLYGRKENPDGPVVLLVHGWEDDHVSWAPLIDRLVATGHRVLAPDLPAHGRSPGRTASVALFAAGLAATAAAAADLGLLPAGQPFCAAIGHSLGGAALLLAAAEGGVAARRIAILAAPNSPLPFAAAMTAMLGLTPAQTQRVFAAIERLAGRSMESLHLPPKLRSLVVPGLVLHSRDDRAVPLQHGREMAAAWPGAQLHMLDGLGHRRLIEDAQVQASLLHFVTSEAPADAFGPKGDPSRTDAA